jgi:hypothetical protein
MDHSRLGTNTALLLQRGKVAKLSGLQKENLILSDVTVIENFGVLISLL